LIGNLEIATGKSISPTVGEARTEEGFARHIERTIATDPNATWWFILDQLNTHKSETLVRLVAEKMGGTQDLGSKGQKGILKKMESRMAYLQNKVHRIRFIYTPKHCSWWPATAAEFDRMFLFRLCPKGHSSGELYKPTRFKV